MLKNLFYKNLDKMIYYTFLFFTGAFVGGFIEISYIFLTENRFVFGGFMFFMWRPMYGWAAIGLDFLLKKYKHSKFYTFLVSMVACTLFEYFTSLIMEILFSQTWWDYTTQPFNFHGRVCLLISIGWGLIGLIYNFLISPTIFKIYTKLNKERLNKALIIALIFYKIDEFFSFANMIK